MKLAFFDTKQYDKIWFEKLKDNYNVDFKYFEVKLNEDTAALAKGCDGVVVFVNDTVDEKTIDILYNMGIKLIALRCAGFNNVDFKSAFGRIHVVRVPAYSPFAVAEHAVALLLTLNRKLHKAYNRTRDFNFNINGLTGFDMHGKTVGVIGTGKIGRVFIDICKGFGMNILAYDPYPCEIDGVKYVTISELCEKSDIISLHCPLSQSTHHLINQETISMMKKGVFIINTSRGALIDSEALLDGLKSQIIGGAGLDVYEEESDLFFEDYSDKIIQDDTIARLLSLPNVLITSHQAFLTEEALHNIAVVTLENIKAFADGAPLENEICYRCKKNGSCKKDHKDRCF